MRVKNRAFENGLLTLGLSGIIDGKEGESTTLAPVSLIFMARMGLMEAFRHIL